MGQSPRDFALNYHSKETGVQDDHPLESDALVLSIQGHLGAVHNVTVDHSVPGRSKEAVQNGEQEILRNVSTGDEEYVALWNLYVAVTKGIRPQGYFQF